MTRVVTLYVWDLRWMRGPGLTLDTTDHRHCLRFSSAEGDKDTIRAGSERRRLAGGHSPYEDNVPESSDPTDLSDLCAELGEWMPMDPLPDNRRASPLLVEAILRSLEESGSSDSSLATSASSVPTVDPSPEASYLSRHLKRRAFAVFWDEKQEPGPSWKQPRIRAALPSTYSTHPPSTQSAPSGTAAYMPQPQRAPYASPYHPSPSWISPGTHASISLSHPSRAAAAQVSLASASAASTLAREPSSASKQASPSVSASRPSLAEPRFSTHPYVRLPTVQPGVVVRAFLPSRMRCLKSVRRSPLALLRRVRELLLQKEIGKDEAEELVALGELIANHLLIRMSFDISEKKPFDAARCLARRFMAFSALASISKALNQGWQNERWWLELATEVPTHYPQKNLDLPGVYPFHADLVRDMMYALQAYKAGRYPPDPLVVSIKRRLFSPERRRCFLGEACWAPWADDDNDTSR
ncbi:hypothetical protein ACSSS7_000728 [Eimeria intestinalis]